MLKGTDNVSRVGGSEHLDVSICIERLYQVAINNTELSNKIGLNGCCCCCYVHCVGDGNFFGCDSVRR